MCHWRLEFNWMQTVASAVLFQDSSLLTRRLPNIWTHIERFGTKKSWSRFFLRMECVEVLVQKYKAALTHFDSCCLSLYFMLLITVHINRPLSGVVSKCVCVCGDQLFHVSEPSSPLHVLLLHSRPTMVTTFFFSNLNQVTDRQTYLCKKLFYVISHYFSQALFWHNATSYFQLHLHQALC